MPIACSMATASCFNCAAGCWRLLPGTAATQPKRQASGKTDGLALAFDDDMIPTAKTDVNRRRDYLHRLGIMTNKKAIFPLPATLSEAPGTLIERPESRAPGRPEARIPGALTEAPGRPEPDGNGDRESSAAVELPEMKMEYLDLKSRDDFRVSFLRKLSYEKVLVPRAQRAPKHQTVIIFDWDDTLLCTSWLNQRQDEVLPPVVRRHLKGIESAAIRLLETSMRLGNTFIITNAMNGWVELSAAKYIPDILQILQRVRVISARSKYESQHPDEVGQWKIQAFLEVQRQLNSEIITNLISIGDSNFEMDAAHVMGKGFETALIKTIKFRENPLPEELLKQLDLVSEKFEKITENAKSLKIGLERK